MPAWKSTHDHQVCYKGIVKIGANPDDHGVAG